MTVFITLFDQKMVQAYETMPLDAFVNAILDITGYRAMLKAAGEEGETRLENIGQLVSSVKTYADQQGEEGPRLPDFWRKSRSSAILTATTKVPMLLF